MKSDRSNQIALQTHQLLKRMTTGEDRRRRHRHNRAHKCERNDDLATSRSSRSRAGLVLVEYPDVVF